MKRAYDKTLTEIVPVHNAPMTKAANYGPYHAGTFGNRFRAWSGIANFLGAVERGEWPRERRIALRLKQTPGTVPPNYCKALPIDESLELANQWLALGVVRSLDEIEISEPADDSWIVVQGELRRDIEHWSFRYSYAKTIMRYAWATHEDNARGMEALGMIKRVMDHESFENLMWLFDKYDSPIGEMIVEFSVYNIRVGTLGWNSVFWEVRAY